MDNKVKKSDSPGWNGQVRLENSEWLAENVKSVDQSVKEMLMLIENDGDLEKVDDSHPKQSDLIARIKEITHKHHLLADHYNKYIQSANEMKNYELTPEKKVGMHNVEGSDPSLSSGGDISDTTPKGGSESSSLSSDSDSESYYTTRMEHSSSLSSRKIPKHEITNMETALSELEGVSAIKVEEYEMLLRRISEYEEESKAANQKIQFKDEEIAKLKSELQKNEAAMVKMGSLEAELVSAKYQIKLHEDETEQESKRSLILHRQIIELEANLVSEKSQTRDLQESVTKYTTQLSDCDHEIEKLNAELQDASGNYALEKWQLESRVSELTENLTFHKAGIEKLQMECESLADEIKKCEAGKDEMEKKHEALKISWQDDIESIKAEVCKKNGLIDTLNENLDGLKLKYDMLMAEKDGVTAMLETLRAEVSSREDQIRKLEQNVVELNSENNWLNVASANANKVKDELESRIDKLEKEVGRQSVVISERDEEKREAIRQLCFSLDYFRTEYEELRSTYVLRKRPTALVL